MGICTYEETSKKKKEKIKKKSICFVKNTYALFSSKRIFTPFIYILLPCIDIGVSKGYTNDTIHLSPARVERSQL